MPYTLGLRASFARIGGQFFPGFGFPMATLTDLPELVGFFSYSREDDIDLHGALSALRNRIQAELRVQLGRTAKTFRLWQDKEAIPSGTMWESEIKNAVAQSAFFIPIITPTVIASTYCKFELEQFLARELALGRDDLVFPILYVDVPALADDLLRQNDPALSLIARRQYADWREFRYLDIASTEVRREIGRFCTDIRDAVRRSWLSPEERKKQEELEALRREEDERHRRESEANRRADDEARRKREAEAQRIADERRKQETEAQRIEDERRKQEAQAQRAAEEEHHRKEFESGLLTTRHKPKQKGDDTGKTTQPAQLGDGSTENYAKPRLRSPVLAGLFLLIGVAYVLAAWVLESGVRGDPIVAASLGLIPLATAIFISLCLIDKIHVPNLVLIAVVVCALGACIFIDGIMWWNLGWSGLDFRKPYFLVGLVAIAALIATLGKAIAVRRD